MAITVNIYYKGKHAIDFAREMISSGTVDLIKAEKGNLRYDYFIPLDQQDVVLLIDSWESQEAIDIHHDSSMMNTIIELRDKYDVHMEVERYVSDQGIPEHDQQFIKA